MKKDPFRKKVMGKGVRYPLSIFSLSVVYGVAIIFSAECKHVEPFDHSVLHPVGRRRYLRMLLEEMVEMSGILKPETITDFRNIPVRVLEQHFGFIGHPVRDMVAGGLARGESYGAIQVIDVDGEVLGKIPGRTKRETLRGRLDGKLSFQKLTKHGRDPRIGVGMLI